MSQPEAIPQPLPELPALERDVGDQQIANDLETGRLGELIAETLEDYRDGRVFKR